MSLAFAICDPGPGCPTSITVMILEHLLLYVHFNATLIWSLRSGLFLCSSLASRRLRLVPAQSLMWSRLPLPHRRRRNASQYAPIPEPRHHNIARDGRPNHSGVGGNSFKSEMGDRVILFWHISHDRHDHHGELLFSFFFPQGLDHSTVVALCVFSCFS